MEEEKYACNICGEVYKNPRLKEACEEIPAEKPIMEIGSVFNCGDNIYGVLYYSEIKKQTHQRSYTLVRGDKNYTKKDGRMVLVPEVKVDRKFLERAKPVTDEEFKRIKSDLEYELVEESEIEHIRRLKQITPFRLEV